MWLGETEPASRRPGQDRDDTNKTPLKKMKTWMQSSVPHARDCPYRSTNDVQIAATPVYTGFHKYANDVESLERSRRSLVQRESQRLQVALEQWVKIC